MPEGIAKELVKVLPCWCATTEGSGGQRTLGQAWEGRSHLMKNR